MKVIAGMLLTGMLFAAEPTAEERITLLKAKADAQLKLTNLYRAQTEFMQSQSAYQAALEAAKKKAGCDLNEDDFKCIPKPEPPKPKEEKK